MKYYIFYLEIALKDENDSKIYAFENVSHIPSRKLIDIFKIDLEADPNILEGYFLTEDSYIRHKNYIEKNIVSINLDVFEYCLRQYGTDNFSEIRKFYKEDLMENGGNG